MAAVSQLFESKVCEKRGMNAEPDHHVFQTILYPTPYFSQVMEGSVLYSHGISSIKTGNCFCAKTSIITKHHSFAPSVGVSTLQFVKEIRHHSQRGTYLHLQARNYLAGIDKCSKDLNFLRHTLSHCRLVVNVRKCTLKLTRVLLEKKSLGLIDFHQNTLNGLVN